MIFQKSLQLSSSSKSSSLLLSIKKLSFQCLSNTISNYCSSYIIKKPLLLPSSSTSSSLVGTPVTKMNRIRLMIVEPIPSSKFSIGQHQQQQQKRQYNCSIIYWANKKIDSKQKDQFIHDHLNSSQDFNENLNNETIPHEQEIVKEPPRERYGVLKAIIIIVAGIYFGAYVAMVGAKLLEDLDIFVQDRDDDDDKD